MEHLVFTGSEHYPYKGILDRIASRCFAQETNAWTDIDHTWYYFPFSVSLQFYLSSSWYWGFYVCFTHLPRCRCCSLLVFLASFFPVTYRQCFLDWGALGEWRRDGWRGCLQWDGICSEHLFWDSKSKSCSSSLRREWLYIRDSKTLGPSPNSSYIGGDIANLRELKPEQIRQFHKEFYRPENMCLIVSGKLGGADAMLLECLQSFEDRYLDRFSSLPPFHRPWSDRSAIYDHHADASQQVVFLSGLDSVCRILPQRGRWWEQYVLDDCCSNGSNWRFRSADQASDPPWVRLSARADLQVSDGLHEFGSSQVLRERAASLWRGHLRAAGKLGGVLRDPV